MGARLAVVLLCMATAVAAEGVVQSPRPMENPRYAVVIPVGEPIAVLKAPVVVAGYAVARSLRPVARPVLAAAVVELALPVAEDLAAVAPPTRKEKRQKKRAAVELTGSVCGVAAIKGEVMAPITSKINGCGVAEPVRVTSVSGVRLSEFPTIDCGEAVALNSWVSDVVQPAFGGKLVELQVAAHYVCRSRNNINGAKISEHGKGKAIDISAFVLEGGKVLTVAANYAGVIRKVHKAACGIFKTTLGPGSDGYHENHLHLDTSARKGGAYCR